jgi:hypothetical protein
MFLKTDPISARKIKFYYLLFIFLAYFTKIQYFRGTTRSCLRVGCIIKDSPDVNSVIWPQQNEWSINLHVFVTRAKWFAPSWLDVRAHHPFLLHTQPPNK